jgi:hypothetical protein
MGGVPDDILLDSVLGLASGRRLLYVPTASVEDPARTQAANGYSRPGCCASGPGDAAHGIPPARRGP